MAGRHHIPGPRGRLDVEITGPDDGATLIFHMGTPSAGSMYAPLVELGAERGLRHVVYMRPGYGDSVRCPGRVVADCAADTAASPIGSAWSVSTRRVGRAAVPMPSHAQPCFPIG